MHAAMFPQAEVLPHESARRQHPPVLDNDPNTLSPTSQELPVLPIKSQAQQKPPTSLPGTGMYF